jgi:hypothetical protein
VQPCTGETGSAFCNFAAGACSGIISPMDTASALSWLVSRWRIGAVIASGLAVACIYKLSTETEEQRAQRAKQKRADEMSKVARQISNYARDLHKRYPDGEVVISDMDLAKQLRKPQDLVANALNQLCDQNQVQRAPLAGYWKLNV